MIENIKITGAIVCDYLWYNNKPLTINEKAQVANRKFEPVWTKDTGLLIGFNENLLAGNTSEGGEVTTSWRVYRKEVGDNNMTPVIVSNDDISQVVDYNIKNNTKYQYVLYSETENYITAPIESGSIQTNWKTWCLFDVDPTIDDKRYTIHKAFTFAFGITPTQMSNNLLSVKYTNFTRYPKVIKSPQRYYSSTLTGLLGYYDCATKAYVENAALLDELNEFTADTRLKFLKDINGHIWQVEVTDPFTSTSKYNGTLTQNEISIGWSEVGSTDGIMITA